ncbi:FAD-dependent oxidoreductase [Streptomonospora salina]|uniref:NADPH-dependent 2,4-dienoyl-CoA reductase/sulfur reductase-like enzyme n=1 Tax=Streptomonospora salina TaxID=104205 RepID=A0A841EEV6_9ACTN|nr:FAD-dependent oxidoreductase [Streptomonospora salina]MBB5998960.1 NADPH-dependent 2,4-dienoyl-CoA reductase/sulfur reductase-like enzyme [Streptomonospora salina]
MNERSRLIVIGGDAAGMSAASQARRLRGAEDLEILALERGHHTSYSACGIPYLVGGTVNSSDSLIARDPATFRRDFGIEVRTATEAEAIDPDRGTVTARTAGGPAVEEPFDALMIATGAVPVRPGLPGMDAPGVFGVQTLADGIAVRDVVDTGRVRTAVVVGGGYIGLEMAEAFVQRGIEVRLIEAASEPMTTLDPDMGRLVHDALLKMGVLVHTDEPVTGVETGPGGAARAVATDRAAYPADIVVLGLGVRPDSEMAGAAGIDVGPTGGIAVDARMRTSAEGVWAGGDCVQSLHRISQAPVAIALGTHANKQGRVAGTDIGGGYERFGGVLGTAISKVCGLEVARTGLNETEAERAGFEFATVALESTTRAGYYPGAELMTTKVLAERTSRRLLGAQIVGRENAAKRVDVLAAALWGAMSVDDVAGMDLGYAPPFSPVWDPVQIAARKLAETV